MYSDAAAERSSNLFKEKVFPLLSPFIGGGQLIKVEGEDRSEADKAIDGYAGIDAWHVYESPQVQTAVRSIASRVQEGQGYETFTIRYSIPSGNPTEYAKRVYAYRQIANCLFPNLTVQAYIDRQGELSSFAAIGTSSLYWFLVDYLAGDERRWIEKGLYFRWARQTRFLVVPWSILMEFLPSGKPIIYKQHQGFARGAEGGKLVFV